ncbi:beta strand repeat-containing protein, partial [Cereibacter changlensis]
ADDRRFTTGFYNIRAIDLAISIGDSDTVATLVQGKNISIEMRAGNAASRSRDNWFADTAIDLLKSLVDMLESVALVGGSARAAVDVSLVSGAAATFRTTGTGKDGDFDVSVVTKTFTSAKPVAIGAGIAVAVTQINQTVDLAGHFVISGDMSVVSIADSSSSAVGASGGVFGIAVGIAANISLIENHVTVTATPTGAASTVGGTLRVAAQTFDRMYSDASASGDKEAKTSIAIGVEVGVGSTIARLQGNVSVAEALVVQADTTQSAIVKKRFYVLPTQANGLAATALLGTSRDNLADSAAEGLNPTAAVGKYGLNTVASKLTGDGKLSKFVNWVNQKVNDPAAPVASKVQVSGAIVVGYDSNVSEALLGYADQTKTSTIVVGGKTIITASTSARPKQSAIALSFNQGEKKDSPPDLAKYSGSAAINVAIFDQDAVARIEGGVRLTARDTVDVSSAASNEFDPMTLPVVNLLAPLIAAKGKPAYQSTEGTQDIKAGDIVQVGQDRYVATMARPQVDLGAETYTDETFWTKFSPAEQIASFLSLLADHVSSDLGFSGFFDMYTQSKARGSVAGVAFAANVLVSDFSATAKIADGAVLVLAPASGAAGDANALTVSTETVNDILLLVGNIEVPGFSFTGHDTEQDSTKGLKTALTSHFKAFAADLKSTSFRNPYKENEGASSKAVGGSVNVSVVTSTARAEVGKATITAQDMSVTAVTRGNQVGLVAAGGTATDASITGSWNHVSLDTTSTATLDARGTLTLSGDLAISAQDSASVFAFAGAMPTSEKNAVGLSGVTSFQSRMVRAGITSLTAAGAGEGVFGIDGDVTIDAKMSGTTVLGSAAVARVKKTSAASGTTGAAANVSTQTPASAAGSAVSQAAGGSQTSKTKGGFSVSGAATGLRERDVTVESILSNLASLTAGALSLSSQDSGARVLLSGALSYNETDEGTGVAGAFAVVDSVKAIRALIEATARAMDLNVAGALSVVARDVSTVVALAAGVAVARGAKGTGVSGSVIVIVGESTVEAALRGGDSSHRITMGATGAVTLTALNDASWIAVAGAGAYGGKVGVGVAVAVQAHEAEVTAEASHLGMASGKTLAGLAVSAQNRQDIHTVAAGAAVSRGSEGGAGVGMVAINVLEQSTNVLLSDATLAVKSGGAVSLAAVNAVVLDAIAGGLALTGGKAAVGVAVAVNVLRDKDGAGAGVSLTGSRLSTAGGGIAVLAGDRATMVATAVGAAAARSVGLAGSAAVNDAETTAKISLDGGSRLSAVGALDLSAQAQGTYVALGGALAIAVPSGDAKSGAVGAGLAINLIETDTTVDLGGALGSTTDAVISAESGQTLVTVAVGGAGAGGFALGGSVATTTLGGATSVSASATSAQGWTVKNLTISAIDSSAITSVAGAVGIGLDYGGVGAAVGVVSNSRDVKATLKGPLTIDASGRMQVSAGSQGPSVAPTSPWRGMAFAGLGDDAFTQAKDGTGAALLSKEDDAKAQIVNVAAAIGGSKMVAVGFNLALTQIDRDVTASVGSGVTVNLSSTDATVAEGLSPGLAIDARDATGIVTVSVGAAA